MPPRKIPISLHCGLNLVREVMGGKWKIFSPWWAPSGGPAPSPAQAAQLLALGWALAAVGALALAMVAILNQLKMIFLYATVAYTWVFVLR
ncbi:hypothetical protein [Hymenobacter psoromatis]|uniref:hypothetical protein n=1 Tax=Hymenobacter psoromatis TaxID=1484116 RepID=UPI001CBB0035|nr:hypothetical protein [Hymenobacter psoromatis]